MEICADNHDRGKRYKTRAVYQRYMRDRERERRREGREKRDTVV